MTLKTVTESVVEDAALEWLENLGWNVVHGPDIAPDTPGAERADYGKVALERRVFDALALLNPDLPETALDEAFRNLTRPEGATLEARNRVVHRLLVDGVTVEYRDTSGAIRGAQEHILAQENGKDRCLKAVRELSQAFALAVPHEDTSRIRDDVAFFQEEFLAEVKGMPQRNLAVELLQKLLKGELATRKQKNIVQARSFAEMLEQTLRRYQNRAIEAAQVIEELIQLARELREANARGEKLGLSEDELAFYDALEINESAVQVLGDETLRDIARELVETVQGSITIDWTLRENVRADLRRLVKRILRKHGYPPDKQEKATRTVLEQAEALSAGWAV